MNIDEKYNTLLILFVAQEAIKISCSWCPRGWICQIESGVPHPILSSAGGAIKLRVISKMVRVADFWHQLGVKRVCHIYCHISGHIKKETHKSSSHLGHKMSKMCQTSVWTVPSRKKWKNQQINKHTSRILANLGHPILEQNSHVVGLVQNIM